MDAPKFKDYECLVHGHKHDETTKPSFIAGSNYDNNGGSKSMRLGYCVRCNIAMFVPGSTPKANDPDFIDRPSWLDDE